MEDNHFIFMEGGSVTPDGKLLLDYPEKWKSSQSVIAGASCKLAAIFSGVPLLWPSSMRSIGVYA